MAVNLKGKDLLTLHDWSSEEIWQVLKTAEHLKRLRHMGQRFEPLSGKTLAMIFAKPSTRTRVSFEAGVTQLGGHALYLSTNDLQLGRGETIADTGRVLSRFVDAIMIRTFKHSHVEELAEAATVPVINGLTDDYHPCQVLADLLTIYEKKGRIEGLKLAYVGDGNNMTHSLMLGGAKLGMSVVCASPAGLSPNPAIVEKARAAAAATGAEISVVNSAAAAVAGADIVYTDVFVSMGQDADRERKLQALAGYRITTALMAQAKPDALFMHCLPAHRGEEVEAAVIDGPQSVVFDEAENRLHAQNGLMVLVM
ncbi:MAG: ornithine carbamoyltransferase [Bacillota bacterium]|nr:ornithine carbamoyltransferase [Bacillota bacterium]